MAVVSSGKIGLNSDVVKEFGGTSPDRASEYYRAPAGAVNNQVTTTITTPNYVPGNRIPGNPIPLSGQPCCPISKGDPCPDACRRCCNSNFSGAQCTCFAKSNPPTVNPGYWTTTNKQGTATVNQGVPTSGTIKWTDWYGTRKT